MIIRDDPEEEDLGRGHQRVAGIEAREIVRAVGPAQAGEGHQPGGEPGIEHVLVLAHRAAAGGTRRQIGRGSRWCAPHPSASQYHTGMRWPHQSWREMHQSRIPSSQAA